MNSSMRDGSLPISVPLIQQVLRHLNDEPGAALPVAIPPGVRGARVFGRYLVLARDPMDFAYRVQKSLTEAKLAGVINAVVADPQSRLYLDRGTWVRTLGDGQSESATAFHRGQMRCGHLAKCLAQLFESLGIPPMDKMPSAALPRKTDGLPEPLREAMPALFSLFLGAFAIGELLAGRKARDGVRPEIARLLTESLDKIESFLFSLVAGLSVSLNAKGNPVLAAIISNESLFRESFDAQGSGEEHGMTLAELEAQLSAE